MKKEIIVNAGTIVAVQNPCFNDVTEQYFQWDDGFALSSWESGIQNMFAPGTRVILTEIGYIDEYGIFEATDVDLTYE